VGAWVREAGGSRQASNPDRARHPGVQGRLAGREGKNIQEGDTEGRKEHRQKVRDKKRRQEKNIQNQGRSARARQAACARARGSVAARQAARRRRVRCAQRAAARGAARVRGAAAQKVEVGRVGREGEGRQNTPRDPPAGTGEAGQRMAGMQV